MPNDAPDWTRASTGVQQLVGTVTAPANGSDTKTFNVPSGTQSIGYLVRSDAGADTPNFLIVQGSPSLNEYFTVTPQNNQGGVQWAPFGIGDTQVTVQLFAGVPSPAKIDVLASSEANAVNATQRFQDVWNVRLFNSTVTALDQALAYDWKVDGAFSAAGTPSVVSPSAAAGKIVVVAYLSASLIVVGAGAAVTPQLQLVDGGVTVRKRAWYALLAVPGQAPPYEVPGLGLGMSGTATWQWDRAIGANQFATLDMGGYFQ